MTTDVLDQPAAETGTDLLVHGTPRDTAVMPGFNSQQSWELAQRIGKAFAASTLVPEQYRGNLANRMGASPLMVMQNLYIVHGNPGWSSKFLIASFNQCGRFSALRYEWTKDRTGCRAWAIEKATGERIEGPQVTLAMAKDEGWSTKNGSKWKTMPELMLMYRSAAFLIRTYAPEISMGLRTDDEIIDMGPADVVTTPRQAKAAEIGALLTGKPTGLAHWRERIENAVDMDGALVELDAARDYLNAAEQAELRTFYAERWEAAANPSTN
jgi:hypothetical protein